MAQSTFPPISDTVALDLLYESNDGLAVVNCQNRLWVHADAPWGATDITDLVEDVRQSWETNIAPLVQVEYILHQINAKNWDNVLNPVIEVPFTPIPGTLGGDPIPFTACGIVRWQTDGVTPSSCYIRHGGIVESQTDGNHFVPSVWVTIAAAWMAVSADINTITRNHVCVQVYQPNPTPPNIFKDNGTVEDITSNLCRRRLGRSVSRQS